MSEISLHCEYSPRIHSHWVDVRFIQYDQFFFMTDNLNIAWELRGWCLENIGFDSNTTWQMIREKTTHDQMRVVAFQFFERKHAVLFMMRWKGITLRFYNADVVEIVK